MTDVREELIEALRHIDLEPGCGHHLSRRKAEAIVDDLGLVRDRKLRILTEAGYEIWRFRGVDAPYAWTHMEKLGENIPRIKHPYHTLDEAIDAAWHHHHHQEQAWPSATTRHTG